MALESTFEAEQDDFPRFVLDARGHSCTLVMPYEPRSVCSVHAARDKVTRVRARE